MSWERSPICVTVPSEGAICKMGSSLVSTQGVKPMLYRDSGMQSPLYSGASSPGHSSLEGGRRVLLAGETHAVSVPARHAHTLCRSHIQHQHSV